MRVATQVPVRLTACDTYVISGGNITRSTILSTRTNTTTTLTQYKAAQHHSHPFFTAVLPLLTNLRDFAATFPLPALPFILGAPPLFLKFPWAIATPTGYVLSISLLPLRGLVALAACLVARRARGGQRCRPPMVILFAVPPEKHCWTISLFDPFQIVGGQKRRT